MPAGERDVLILLSAHDGERYLTQQIDSLKAQTIARRIHLLVRDDGSTDSTSAILAAIDPGLLEIEIVTGPNLGARDSFAALMELAGDDFPLIMFCDQDDVWLPDKVEAALSCLDGLPTEVPALYCGRSFLTDQDLAVIGETEPAPLTIDLHQAIFHNIAPGHTMAFNQALLRLGRDTIGPAAIMHDWWLYCLAAGLGRVVFDPVSHAWYRQHGGNEIGYAVGPWQRLRQKADRLLHEDRSMIIHTRIQYRILLPDCLRLSY